MVEDRIRPARKFVGHVVVGTVGASVRANIASRPDMTPAQKAIAKGIVSILQGLGHAWVDANL